MVLRLILAVLVGLGAPVVPAVRAADTGEDPVGSGLLDRTDLWLLGAGAAVGAGSRFLLNPRTRDVPTEGLDRADIRLRWDRRAIGVPDENAVSLSTALLAGAAAAPHLLTLAGGDPRPGRTRLRVAVLQAESMVLALGASYLVKQIVSRPRPFTYFAEGDRPGGERYDVSRDWAFQSFPSNHAVLAWSGAASGVSVLALEHPRLSHTLHFLGGSLAGGLATAASLLRVESTLHFPTDVAAGAALGMTSGAGLALLRAERGEGPRSRALWAGVAGMAVGSVIAFLLTPPTSPWID
jgi:membrane-associated phospholipid phosphatase